MCSFGSGSSGPSAPTTQFTTQTTTADPRAQAMYGQAWHAATQAANRPFQPYSYDPSAFVAPINPLQLQAMGNIAGYQGAADPFYSMAGGLAGASGMTTTPQVVSQYMSPYMQQVVDPTRQAIEQQQGVQRSQQQTEQIKAGALGQERGQLMRAVLAGQQNLGLGQALAPLYQTGYGQALQGAQADLSRQLQAAQTLGGLGTGYQTAGLQGAQALLGAGTLGQQTQQAGLQALNNQYMLQQQYPFLTSQYLAQTAGALGPGYGGTTTGTQQSMQPLSFWGNPLSDPDLKTGAKGDGSEPEVIGETKDGQKIYRYRLIDPDTGELGPPQIGLMADEVEERTPEAVGDYKGYRTVDYAKATDDAARLGGGVTGRGDYADGGGILDDILASQSKMYEPLSKSTERGIVPTGTITPAKLESPSLSYAKPPQQEQSSLAQGLGSALNLYKGGKEAFGLAKEAGSALGLGSLLSGLGGAAGTVGATGGVPVGVMGALGSTAVPTFGAAASAAAPGILSSLGSAIMSALPFLATLSDPSLKTGVRPKAADGMAVSSDDQGLDYLARTLVREAGGEGEKGMEAVADVVRNRLQSGQYGKSLQDVVTAPKQFSPWNPEARGTRADPRLVDPSSELYKTALGIGQRVLGGAEDITGGATHFYNPDLASPKWGEGMQDAQMIGHHRFGRADAGARPLAYASTEKPGLGGALDAISRIGGGTMRSDDTKSSAGLASTRLAAAPEGLSGFLRGTAPEGAGEKAADFLTSEKFIVPLLAGLGTMASSGSRFLAPSILQGLGGGAKAYAELAQQQFERQKMAEELGLRARETAVKEAGIPLTERELKIKEQEAARKMRALQELAKTAGKAYEAPTAPAAAPSPVAPEAPSAAPAETAPTAPATAPKPAGAVDKEFWSDVDPMMNPTNLLSMAQEAERKASVAAQDFPEWSKMLNDQALKFRGAASDILKSGAVLKGGQMVPIPGAIETEKQKATAAEQAKTDLELVEVQPKIGGPTLKMTRKEARDLQPGAGTPPGAIVTKQPASAEKQVEAIRNDEVAMLDQFRQRQAAKERMDALIDSLRILETGKFAERKAEAVAALRAIGFDVPDTATANPAEFQKFVKNSTANVFDQVKAMGGKILVSEITGLTKANANPELQPSANAALLGQAKGLLDYEDQHFQDYSDWRKQNPDAYSVQDVGDFERGWVKGNPLGKYVKEAEMGIGARGAPLLPIDKRQPGYTYTNDQGITARWNGKSWDVLGGPNR